MNTSQSEIPVTPRDRGSPPYWLYLLECTGGKFYAGIALDVEDRFMKHLSGKGAAYTRANPPLQVLACAQFSTKGEALKAEYAVKQLPKARKLAFFHQAEPIGASVRFLV